MVKTEKKMLPNGNYEAIFSPVQHKCHSKDGNWTCVEYGWELGILKLTISYGDPYEDGYEDEIEVNFCPFCGYCPSNNKKL